MVSPESATKVACRKVQVAPAQVPPASALLLTVIVAERADTATSEARMNAMSEVRYRERDCFISKTPFFVQRRPASKRNRDLRKIEGRCKFLSFYFYVKTFSPGSQPRSVRRPLLVEQL
jgi:hypothetical protein